VGDVVCGVMEKEITMSDNIESHINALDNIIEALQRERMSLAKTFSISLLNKDDAIKIAEVIMKSGKQKLSSQSSDWAGYIVAELLGIQLSSDIGRLQVMRHLSDIVAMGMLKVGYVRDSKKGRDIPIYLTA
jgi:hypothetical protein